MQERIPRRATTALLHSLAAGVVPRIGLEHIAVGRKREVEALLGDLASIEAGGAGFRFVVGAYGSGKSFLLQMMRNHAMERGFAVADADLSPERRLTGTKGQGLATYRELLQHLATRTRPEGGALEAALQRWLGAMQLDPDRLRQGLRELTSRLEGMVMGFDFAAAVGAYARGYLSGDDAQMQSALRWLRGEYTTRTEARAQLRVGTIVTDENWYDCLKLVAVFLREIGYKGLFVCIDEAVNLYKITNRVSRENNYEKLLSIFNDAMQGQVAYLGVLMGGTPQFVEDERRGLFSYDALRSRLADSRYLAGHIDYQSPVLRLSMLGQDELFVLLRRLSIVHASHYGYAVNLTDAQYVRFLQSVLGRIGAQELLTPREITRDFLTLLNLAHQGDQTFDGLLDGGFTVQAANVNPEVLSAEPEADEFAEFAL